MGIDKVDYFISLYPSGKLFESTVEMGKAIEIKQVYMPKWQGFMEYGAWKKWKQLVENNKENHRKLRLITKTIDLKPSINLIINLNVEDKFIRRNGVKYPQFTLKINQLQGR